MNTAYWKNIDIEYGKNILKVKVPPYCDILKVDYPPPLKEPEKDIENALSNPIGTLPIEKIVASCKKPSSEVTVAIAVSDNTRPVPYHAESKEGILLPILGRLQKAKVKRENITIIVATGTHVPTSKEWKKETFGEYITERYCIIDHDCISKDLVFLGDVEGVSVKVNKKFMEADVRIITGLVEPHFMAGVSGGRKTICPGLVNLETTYVFHGAEFIDDPNATNLVLRKNPCHEFSLKVARKARVDFSVNVTIDGEGRLTDVFAGDMEKAHFKAFEKVRKYTLIPCKDEYDIVLTHGGKVAVNHYQAAKAAYGATPIVKKGGMVILVAHNGDEEPVGKEEYKKVLKILKDKGPGKFTELIKDKNWKFVPDQWQVQKWDQFFRKIGCFDNLIYCTTNISSKDLKDLPGKSGYDFVEKSDKPDPEKMVQNAIFYVLTVAKKRLGKEPKMAFIREGPYAVPTLEDKNLTAR